MPKQQQRVGTLKSIILNGEMNMILSSENRDKVEISSLILIRILGYCAMQAAQDWVLYYNKRSMRLIHPTVGNQLHLNPDS